MSKSFIITFMILLLSIFTTFSFSQQAAPSVKRDFIVYRDSALKISPASGDDFEVEVRVLSEDNLERYKNDPDFIYDEKLIEAEDLWTKTKSLINQALARIRTSETYYTILDFVYYGLMIIAILLIIRGLIKADRRGLIFGELSSYEIKISEGEEEISKLNFDDLIKAAIENNNYKLAVRYLFLKSLQLLSDKEIITLSENKTNHQYLSEIKNDKISKMFGKTTAVFEWIWYGDFPVDEKLMKSSQNEFNELFGLIGF